MKIRSIILTALSASVLAVSMQSAYAQPQLKAPPHIKLPGNFGPGGFKPNPPKAPKPHKPHHNNNAAAAAALGIIGGMVVGSAIANANRQPVQTAGGHDAHVGWCLQRYRSYDIPTDTYMSHSGVRKYCNSPYN